MNLSENLTLAEAIYSDYAKKHNIDNSPSPSDVKNLKLVANNIFQKVRNHFKVPIFVSSGFRGYILNKRLGGSKNSDHMYGRALDIDADKYGGVSNKEIFLYIYDNLDFKQLIWEFGSDKNPDWVHASYEEGNNKKEVLQAIRRNGKTSYLRMSKSDIDKLRDK